MTDTVTAMPTHEAGEAIANLLTDDLQAGDQTPVPGSAEPHDGPAEAPAQAQPAHQADDAENDVPAAAKADEQDEPTAEDRLADEAEQAEPATDRGELFTVRLPEGEAQVPLSELVNGYARQRDYTQKTMQLADERRALEAERSQYGTLLSALHERLVELQPETPNFEVLAQVNPAEYVRQTELARQKQAVAYEEARLNAIEEAKDAEYRSQRMAASQQWLLSQVPEWSDTQTRTKELSAIVNQARTLGFTDQELEAADDPRILLLARKAAKYDELMSSAEDVKRRAVQRNHKKVLPAGSAASVDNAPRAKAKGMAKLRQSGSLEDAASLLAGMVE